MLKVGRKVMHTKEEGPWNLKKGIGSLCHFEWAYSS